MSRFSRRQFLQVAAAAPLYVYSHGLSLAQGNKEAYADPAAAAQWLDTALKEKTKAPTGGWAISRFADPVYFVTRPMGWEPNPGDPPYKPVTVPPGFVTDFASIPRLFWSLLRPDGLYAYAAVIHDYLYWEREGRSREEADAIFRLAMQDFKVSPALAGTLYEAVRFGAEGAWEENARLKAKGERRIMKRLPEDPTVRWADWKRRAGVF